MKSRAIKALSLVMLLASGCTNLFTDYSNTQTDAALLFAANQYIDSGDYSDAIALFPKFSTAYQNDPNVKYTESKAYLGRAGLNFITFAQGLSALNLSSEELFLFFMKNFDHGSANTMADATQAVTLLLSIAPNGAGFTNDQLVALVFAGMTSMGNILSRYADPTATGSVTAGFNPCTGIPSAASPNDAAQQFGLAFNAVVMALTQLSANGQTIGPAWVSAICTGLSGDFTLKGVPTYAFCGVYTETGFTPAQVLGILSLITEKAVDVGLGTCGTAPFDAGTCHC